MSTRDTTLSQANNPPRSIQVGYGTYTQAYAALDRARATRTTGPSQPAPTSHEDVPSTGLNNPTHGVPHGLPHRSHRSRGVQTTQSLPLSHLHMHTPSATGDLRTPLGSSATPMAPRLIHPPLPPSSSTSTNPRIYSYTPPATDGLRTPLGSSATPPMAPRLMNLSLPPSSRTSSNAHISEPGISDEATYRVVLRHGPNLDIYVYYGK